MKHLATLLLFFLSNNLLADIKIDVINNVTGRTYSAKFETQPELDIWKSEQIANDSWGKKDRWLKKEIGDVCANGERTFGNIVEGFYQECFYPVEYTITETDITTQIQAEKALKEIKKDMNFGSDLYAKIRLKSMQKSLTKAQRKQMRNDFASVRDDLFDGDICSAREDVAAINNNPIITNADRDEIVALIDLYKTCP